ncbi:LysR substrate-binding domain-containing protein [Methylomonas sp. HW2-6]|uniref:LysR substrate-binding domain-containing protein n=1 Tax=Methylomonas sp. HW2-6 TaxID=3376687 RepID=UPI004042F41D
MNIEANDLWLFAKIADAGSFSKAGELLGLPKSTLSRRISHLEKQLGERLLQRTTRQLHLTEFGLRLLQHGRQIGEEIDAALAWAEHRQTEPSGRLRISLPNDFATLFLVPVLADFNERYPAIALEIDLSARRVDLVGENFDLAIRMGELPDDASLTAKRLSQQDWGLYASPEYLERHGQPQQPEDLNRYHALTLPGRYREQPLWQLDCGNLSWQGLPPARILANSPELLVKLACRGRGIVAAPVSYAAAYLKSGELQRVLPGWCLPQTTAWLVFPGRKLMPGKTRAFIDFLIASQQQPA